MMDMPLPVSSTGRAGRGRPGGGSATGRRPPAGAAGDKGRQVLRPVAIAGVETGHPPIIIHPHRPSLQGASSWFARPGNHECMRGLFLCLFVVCGRCCCAVSNLWTANGVFLTNELDHFEAAEGFLWAMEEMRSLTWPRRSLCWPDDEISFGRVDGLLHSLIS